MPQIPLITSQEKVNIGGIDVYATPDQAGAGIGQQLQRLGKTVAGFSDIFAEQQDKLSRETYANAVANTDITSIMLKNRTEIPPDAPAGEDMVTLTYQQSKDLIDKTADEIQDDNARTAYRSTMYNRLGSQRDEQTRYLFGAKGQQSIDNANAGLDQVTNRVRMDHRSYATAVEDADAIIDARTEIPPAQREDMKRQSHSNLAQARFESLVANAQKVEDYDNAEEELNTEEWQSVLSKEAFDKVQNNIGASRNAFISGQDAKARAELVTINERLSRGETIPDVEMVELGKMVDNSKSPTISMQYGRARALNDENRVYGKQPPEAIRQRSQYLKSKQQNLAGNADLMRAADDASAATGGVIKPSYVMGMLGREYNAKDIMEGRYNVKNPKSTAQGLGQFIDGTWIDMMRKYGARFGYNPGAMTRAQLLAVRNDPSMSMKMSALYAQENREKLVLALGIEPSETDLYIAHFLGPGGAIDFLKMVRTNPRNVTAPNGAFTQKAILANWNVFHHKNTGRILTYEEVYKKIGASFIPGTDAAQSDITNHLDKMAASKQTQVNADMIAVGRQDGRIPFYPLENDQDFVRRGRDAQLIADTYNIPKGDWKPFDQDEAAAMSTALKNATGREQLALLGQIQLLDQGSPGMAQAARNQLGLKDTVLGYAAELKYEKGQGETASQIIYGQEIIKNDKTRLGKFGEADRDAVIAFYAYAEHAFDGLPGERRTAILDAAKAHYMATTDATTPFDADTFQRSINKVLGNSVGEVNGMPAVLPPNTTSEEFNTAIDNISDEEFISRSLDGLPPIDAFGDRVMAEDVAAEGEFVWIGATAYNIRMADGGYLSVAKQGPNGERVRFTFVADPQRIRELAHEADEAEAAVTRGTEVPPNALPQPGSLESLRPPQ